MEPILKWAGGKRFLLPEIVRYIDFDNLKNNNRKYYEPFIGGGALCFSSEYPYAVINDYNADIINVYKVIKKSPYKLIEELKILKKRYDNDKKVYYEIRAWDRDKDKFNSLSSIEKAARTIFLNKTCYNGLYRVNSRGEFNVPIGRYKTVDIVNEEKIIALHKYLYKNKITIRNGDFEDAVADARAGDVVYLDPPYDYEPSGFTSYNSSGFTADDTRRLRDLCDNLIERGCYVIISNNDTRYVNELFAGDNYEIHHILAHRFINSDGTKRNKAKEVVICGYRR